MPTAPATDSAALSPCSIPTKSSTASGNDLASTFTLVKGRASDLHSQGRPAHENGAERRRGGQGSAEVGGGWHVAQVDRLGGPAGARGRPDGGRGGDGQGGPAAGPAVAGPTRRAVLAGPPPEQPPAAPQPLAPT